MKGMNRIKRGKGFLGLIKYALEKDRGQVIGGNIFGRVFHDSEDMFGATENQIAAHLGATRNLRRDIEKPVWHNSLRLPKGERVAPDFLTKIADEYMHRMGFKPDHPRVYIMHDDPDGQHVHIAANRISVSGEIYLGQNENFISTDIIQELEKDFGLKRTPGRKPRMQRAKEGEFQSGKAKPTKGEIEMGLRTGELPPKLILQGLLDNAVEGRPTASDFVDRLITAGVRVRPNVAKTGRLNGFSFEYGGIVFKGSQLGAKYAWRNLSELVDYEQTRDCAALERARDRAAETDAGDSERNSAVAGEYVGEAGDAGGGSIEPGRAAEDAGGVGSIMERIRRAGDITRAVAGEIAGAIGEIRGGIDAVERQIQKLISEEIASARKKKAEDEARKKAEAEAAAAVEAIPDLKPAARPAPAALPPLRLRQAPARPPAAPAPGALRMAPDERLAAALAYVDEQGLDALTDAYVDEVMELALARLAAIQADRQAAAAAQGGAAWAAHNRDNAEEVADLRERVKVVRQFIAQRDGLADR